MDAEGHHRGRPPSRRWLGLALVGFAAIAASRPLVAQPALDRAATAAQAIQAELDRRIAVLAELAAASALDRPFGTLRELDRLARAAAERLGAPVSIADGSLAGLVDTAEEFGTPLPGLADMPVALEALEAARPALAEIAEDAEAPLRLAVPALRDGRVRAVLATPLARAVLERRLAEAGGAGVLLLGPGDRLLAAAGPLSPAALLQAAVQGSEAFALSTRPLALGAGWRILAAEPLPPSAPAPVPAPPLAPAAARGAPQGAGAWLLGGGMAGVALLGGGAAMLRRRRAAPPPGEAAALHSLVEMRRLNDAIPVGLALLDRELRFASVNARFAGVSGLAACDHLRRLPADVLPPAVAEALAAPARAVLATGQPALDVPISAEAPGEIRNERHYLVSCHPAEDSTGRVTGVSIVLQDVTDRVRAERARALLVRELNHRVKNTLATVQSIVASTLRQTGDTTRFAAALNARLQALARAHDLLTARDWLATELGEAVQAALAPWLQEKPARIIVDGPGGVTLRPSQAQALVLALHELATNAVKYGALSVAEGRVGVIWEAAAGEPVRLRWVETGGPLVTEPTRDARGFGTRLLERALATDLGSGATVRLHFAPQGLRALVTFGAEAAPCCTAAPPLALAPAA